MEHVEVQRELAAPPGRVWARYSDHARWSEWAGLPGSRLVRPGRPDPNGTGAVRAFAGGVHEEVLDFEPPARMTYRVIGGPFPVRDHRGEVVLEPVRDGDATRITWRCRFAPRLPGTGPLLRWLVTRVFERALDGLARDLA